MNNSIKKIIANKLALSFFITAIIILIIYLFIYDRFVYYANIINTTSVSIKKINKETKYDPYTKRIIGYPTYGEKYADIIIDSLNINLPIYHGDNLDILKKGVGHYAGSYFPGEGGTIILAGHNNVGYFNNLEDINIDDIIKINANYGKFQYKVYETKIVNENDLKAFDINKDNEVLIVYTCYPMGKNRVGRKTKRYVLYANLIGENYE